MKQNILIVVIVIFFAGVSRAESRSVKALDYWPAWRGPLANGTAPHADPPIEWSQSKNVKWKLDIPGQSNATPIIWADRIFVVTAVESERTVDQLLAPKMEPPRGYRTKRPRHYYQFLVYCIDRQTGQILWKRIVAEKVPHEGRHGTNTYASGSPTTDGQRLYVTFGSHGLFCYDLDGNPLWQRDLGDMITRFGWGEGASPTVYGDTLAINWDHERASAVYVLDTKTGKPLMDNVRLPDLNHLYASPLGASGRIYFVGRNGTAVVIKNQPELDVLAVNRLDDPMDASPVAVGRELFLRSKTNLYCITRPEG